MKELLNDQGTGSGMTWWIINEMKEGKKERKERNKTINKRWNTNEKVSK
jgi:hypothetical protein